MDALSHIVRLARLQASLDLRCQFSAGFSVDHAGGPVREVEFHLVLAGRCVIEIPHAPSIDLGPGDFVAFHGGTPHRLRSVGEVDVHHRSATSQVGLLPIRRSESGDTELDLLCGRFLIDSATMDQLFSSLPRAWQVSLSESTPDIDLRVIVAMIRAEVEAEAPGAVAIVEAFCTVLLTLALRIHSRRDAVTPSLLRLIGDARMARAAQAILTDPGRSWSLEQLAALSSMSRATFARRFGEVSSMTPGTLLLQVRMSRAADLLHRSRRGVADIGAEMGYQSEAAFSKAFKRTMAMSPAAWRRSRRDAKSQDGEVGAAGGHDADASG